MAPLFSKVDSNKLWHDVQHEENVIYGQFGKDLLNISKVIGRKKVAQFFLTHSVVHILALTWDFGSDTTAGCCRQSEPTCRLYTKMVVFLLLVLSLEINILTP